MVFKYIYIESYDYMKTFNIYEILVTV